MGNMLLRGLVHCYGRRIKIIRTDGTVMKLRVRGPVSVKEILVDYPDHQIFEALAGSPLGIISSFSGPLPEWVGLVAGHLYYLIPLPYHPVINCNTNWKRGPFPRSASSDHSIPTAARSRLLQPQSSADIATADSIKQKADCAVNKVNRGGVGIVSCSYSTDGSTVRVKLRLRKEDLASFLSALTQNATQQSPWKPRLDAIA